MDTRKPARHRGLTPTPICNQPPQRGLARVPVRKSTPRKLKGHHESGAWPCTWKPSESRTHPAQAGAPYACPAAHPPEPPNRAHCPPQPTSVPQSSSSQGASCLLPSPPQASCAPPLSRTTLTASTVSQTTSPRAAHSPGLHPGTPPEAWARSGHKKVRRCSCLKELAAGDPTALAGTSWTAAPSPMAPHTTCREAATPSPLGRLSPTTHARQAGSEACRFHGTCKASSDTRLPARVARGAHAVTTEADRTKHDLLG